MNRNERWVAEIVNTVSDYRVLALGLGSRAVNEVDGLLVGLGIKVRRTGGKLVRAADSVIKAIDSATNEK